MVSGSRIVDAQAHTRMKVEPICVNSGCDPCFWYSDPDHVPEEKKRSVDDTSSSKRRIRAGVFLYNRKEDKLLVVQAYGKYVGLPKGGREKKESLVETALRELQEETGVILPPEKIDPTHRITLHGTARYYIVETDVCYPLKIAGSTLPNNDVSGAGWVHIDCLTKVGGRITSHLRQMVQRVLHR